MDKMELLVGRRIAEARTNRNLTQEQLAERCDISTSALSRIENGYNGTSLKTLLNIADALNVGLDYLLYDLMYHPDSDPLAPEIQEILFLLEPMPEPDLKFVHKFVLSYANRIKDFE